MFPAKSGTGCTGLSNAPGETVSVQAPAAPGPGGGAANLDQCENGTFTSFQICQNPNWVNGNLNRNNSHYREGDSVPFRMRMSGFNNTGPHTLVIEYDTTKSGAHAYDYLTSYNRTEGSANPCSGVAGCTLAGATFFPIPTDPSLANASPPVVPVAQALRQMAIWNGTITESPTREGRPLEGTGEVLRAPTSPRR